MTKSDDQRPKKLYLMVLSNKEWKDGENDIQNQIDYLMVKTRFLIEHRSFCFWDVAPPLERQTVRYHAKTKGQGYINLVTKLPVVRGEPVPDCSIWQRDEIPWLCELSCMPCLTSLPSAAIRSAAQSPQTRELARLLHPPYRDCFCMTPSPQNTTQCFEHFLSVTRRAVLYTDWHWM